MGNMRYPLYGGGCTTDKLSRYLYMIGGDDGSAAGSRNGEYIDLKEYELYGFNYSYYDMGKIIDNQFRNSYRPHGWRYPNCFSSQYSNNIIYCGGGLLPTPYVGEPTKELWIFDRFYSPESYTFGSDAIKSPEIYGCSKGPNYSEYFFYPKCAGFIGHNIKKYLEPGPHNSDVINAPREYRNGCSTPWYSVNTNFSIKFYLGGKGISNSIEDNALIIREDSYLFPVEPSMEPTTLPTIIPTIIPTLNPTKTPTDTPTMLPTFRPIEFDSDNSTFMFSTHLIIMAIIIVVLLLAIIITFIIYKYYSRFKESQISDIKQNKRQVIENQLNDIIHYIPNPNITKNDDPNIISSINYNSNNIGAQIEGDNKNTTHSPVINVKTKKVT